MGWERRLREAEIFLEWERAVGPRIARHSRPAYVRGGRLTIIVDSPAWSQQLSLLRPELLRRISAVAGEGVIEDIFLTSGTVEPPPPAEEHQAPAVPPEDPELLAAIDRESSRIKDDSLRKAFRDTLLAATRPTKFPP